MRRGSIRGALIVSALALVGACGAEPTVGSESSKATDKTQGSAAPSEAAHATKAEYGPFGATKAAEGTAGFDALFSAAALASGKSFGQDVIEHFNCDGPAANDDATAKRLRERIQGDSSIEGRLNLVDVTCRTSGCKVVFRYAGDPSDAKFYYADHDLMAAVCKAESTLCDRIVSGATVAPIDHPLHEDIMYFGKTPVDPEQERIQAQEQERIQALIQERTQAQHAPTLY